MKVGITRILLDARQVGLCSRVGVRVWDVLKKIGVGRGREIEVARGSIQKMLFGLLFGNEYHKHVLCERLYPRSILRWRAGLLALNE